MSMRLARRTSLPLQVAAAGRGPKVARESRGWGGATRKAISLSAATLTAQVMSSISMCTGLLGGAGCRPSITRGNLSLPPSLPPPPSLSSWPPPSLPPSLLLTFECPHRRSPLTKRGNNVCARTSVSVCMRACACKLSPLHRKRERKPMPHKPAPEGARGVEAQSFCFCFATRAFVGQSSCATKGFVRGTSR